MRLTAFAFRSRTAVCSPRICGMMASCREHKVQIARLIGTLALLLLAWSAAWLYLSISERALGRKAHVKASATTSMHAEGKLD